MTDRGKQFLNSASVLLDSWGVALRHRTPWRELTPRQRKAMMVRGALQLGLLAAALNDLRRRPASQIRGPKPLWASHLPYQLSGGRPDRLLPARPAAARGPALTSSGTTSH